jgi:hypothetical protein
VLRNVKGLAFSGRRSGVPILVTEQYPRGLRHTLPELRPGLPDLRAIENTAFSCCGADGCVEQTVVRQLVGRADADVFREISKLWR